MLDLGALEEPQAAVDAVRDAGVEQRVLDHARLRVRAIQHGDLGARVTFGDQSLDLVDQPRGLVAVGLRLVDAHRLALAGVGPQFLAEPARIVGDQRIGGVQDVPDRAVVLLELDQVLHAELALEVGHVADVGTAECVDRLVVVADREDGVLRAGEQLQPRVLQLVGVLKLVDQDVAEAVLVVLRRISLRSSSS